MKLFVMYLNIINKTLKQRIPPIFHFEYVNKVWISGVLGVKMVSRLKLYLMNLKSEGGEGSLGSPNMTSKGWFDEFETGLNIIIAIVQKVTKPFFCQNGDHFGQRTAWSLLYFLNYGYYDIYLSLKIIESPFILLSWNSDSWVCPQYKNDRSRKLEPNPCQKTFFEQVWQEI